MMLKNQINGNSTYFETLQNIQIFHLDICNFDHIIYGLHDKDIEVIKSIQKAIEKKMDEISQTLYSTRLYCKNIEKTLELTVVVDEYKQNGQDWKLIGQQILGVNHGKFHYKKQGVNSQEIIQGGNYYFNNKHGQWKEFLGNCEMNGCYFYGKKEGIWELLFKNKQIGQGKYNSSGEKEGFWVDILTVGKHNDEAQTILQQKNLNWIVDRSQGRLSRRYILTGKPRNPI